MRVNEAKRIPVAAKLKGAGRRRSREIPAAKIVGRIYFHSIAKVTKTANDNPASKVKAVRTAVWIIVSSPGESMDPGFRRKLLKVRENPQRNRIKGRAKTSFLITTIKLIVAP